MNKRGFTLVELLATIVILGIVITLVATKNFGAFNNSKKSISELSYKGLYKASNELAESINNCDDDIDTDLLSKANGSIAKINGISDPTCETLKEKLSVDNECLKITIGYLKSNNYVTGNDADSFDDNKFIYICEEENSIKLYEEENKPTTTTTATTTTTKKPTTTTTTKPVDPCLNIDYNKNTLAYNIICNAKSNKIESSLNAYYRSTPLTTPGVNVSQKWRDKGILESSSLISSNISLSYQSYYWTYATNYTFNSDNGTYSLKDPKACQYNESGCLSDLIKNSTPIYLVSSSPYSNTKSTNTKVTTTGLTSVYKLIEAPKPGEDIYLKTKNSSKESYNGESTLSETLDDDGTSYYFRGGVENNYLSFNGMCWRIVRILGDGSIRLILEDQDQVCSSSIDSNYSIGSAVFGINSSYTNNAGYTIRKLDYLRSYSNSNSLANTFENFQKTKLSNVLYKLKSGGWCHDTSAYSNDTPSVKITNITPYYQSNTTFYYGANRRIASKTPSLKCNVDTLANYYDKTAMYVATLTADEIIYAGSTSSADNTSFYLMNNLKSWWWTLSPHTFTDSPSGEDHEYHISSVGRITCIGCYVGYNSGSRPAITLKSGTTLLNGDGTKNNSYIIG